MFALTVPLRADDHAIGPADAPVSVVEYGDFECPNCKQAAPAVKLLLRHFSDRVRFVYRHFPLEEVHPHAVAAAEAAECASEQGKFWPMHDLLFDNQANLMLAQLQSYGARLSLDSARYATAMEEHRHLSRIRAQMQSGRDSGCRHTPTFFVDGKIQDVSFGLRALFVAVEASLRTTNQA